PTDHSALRAFPTRRSSDLSEGGKITADQGRNALIVSGDPAVRQTLTGLISAFDIDALAGQSYALFPAGDKAPDRLAAELEKVLRIDNDGPLSGIVRVVPMSRVNAVLVVSAQPRYIDEARRFLGLERRVEGRQPAGGTSITSRTGRAPISKTCCNGRSRHAM